MHDEQRSVVVPRYKNKGDLLTFIIESHYETLGESNGAKTWAKDQDT